MHKKWLEVCINLLFWVASAWLIISSFSIHSQEIENINGIETIEIHRDSGLIWQLSVVVVASVLMFYLNFFNLQRLRWNISRKKIVLRSAMSVIQGILLFYLVSQLPFFRLRFLADYGVIISIFVFYFTVSTAYGLAKVWVHAEARNKSLAFEKKQAELNLLRSQLHPHFLFNVLNNLLAMVDQAKNPALALSIDKLSSLLRYVVYEAKEEKVSLAKEIAFIRDFADLQVLRFEEEEVSFELNLLGNPELIMIEPGIFVPFIENAFNYGLMPEKKSKIALSFDLREKNLLFFSIQNPFYPEKKKQNGAGTGIISVKNRLALVYPGRHQLKIQENHLFRVELSIQLHESDYRR